MKIMKRRKILVSILISILLLIVGAVPAFAATIPEDQLGWRSYNAEDGTKYVVITECICEDPVWEFPAEIDGKPVLKIEQLHPDDASFSNTTTKEIIIPEGVEEINYAFVSYFALEKVTLPESLKKISWSCFRGCSALKEINLPEGLEVIDYDAFSYCKALEAVKIPDSVTELGKQAFFNCTSLKEVTLGAGIKEIPDSAFDECMALTSIVIPEGVERIGEYAFDGSLKTVTLPKSLTYVDRSGFIFGNLEKVVYNGTEEEFEQIESYDDEIRFIQCPIEYADGTIGGTDISQNSGSSDGEKSGTVLFVTITVIVILVLVSASAFFIARRNKQAKQK
mgnify:FL=1